MKVCPYCKEEIKDDAVKCRYCQSALLTLPLTTSEESNRVTYILDRDLIRFAKFGGAVLSVMVVVGLFLFGIDIKNMQEKMSKNQEEMNKTLQENKKYADEAKVLHNQVIGLEPKIQEAEERLKRIEGYEHTASEASERITLVEVKLSEEVARSQGPHASTGNAQGTHLYHAYTESEIKILIAADANKARKFFESLGLHPPNIPTRIFSEDRELANVFWDGKAVVFGMGMVNSEFFGPYDPRLVYHESCHSLFHIQFQGQSGALSESICDVLAVALAGQDWNIGLVKTGDPTKPAHLRSLQDPGSAYNITVLGKDPQVSFMGDYNNGSVDNGGVHINNGIPNKAAYLMSEGGTFHGIAVAKGMGRAKLAKLYAACIQKFAKGSSVDFRQWRDLLLSEATAVYGKNSSEVQTVVEAFRAVGVS